MNKETYLQNQQKWALLLMLIFGNVTNLGHQKQTAFNKQIHLPFGRPVVYYRGQIRILLAFWNPLYIGK